MKAIFFAVTLIVGALSSTAWSASDTAGVIQQASGKCDPLFCNCLPPNTPRDKGCSSRTPDKQCVPTGGNAGSNTASKMDCGTYCKHVVENCN